MNQGVRAINMLPGTPYLQNMVVPVTRRTGAGIRIGAGEVQAMPGLVGPTFKDVASDVRGDDWSPVFSVAAMFGALPALGKAWDDVKLMAQRDPDCVAEARKLGMTPEDVFCYYCMAAELEKGYSPMAPLNHLIDGYKDAEKWLFWCLHNGKVDADSYRNGSSWNDFLHQVWNCCVMNYPQLTVVAVLSIMQEMIDDGIDEVISVPEPIWLGGYRVEGGKALADSWDMYKQLWLQQQAGQKLGATFDPLANLRGRAQFSSAKRAADWLVDTGNETGWRSCKVVDKAFKEVA